MSARNRPSDLVARLAAAQAAAAQAEAEASRARAAAAAAQRLAMEEQTARRRAHARSVLDTFDRDQQRALDAVDAARKRFAIIARTDLPNAIGAYLAWVEATSRLVMVYTRLGNAAGTLEVETWQGRALPSLPNRGMPSFTEALDQALRDAIQETRDAVDEAYQEEIAAVLAGTASAP